jgi:hypothetical protein
MHNRAMHLALGLSVHTGWAACVLAGGTLRAPRLEAREHVELAGDPERFVFHRAAEMDRADATRSVAKVRSDAIARATGVMKRMIAGRDVEACAIVAKPGEIPELDTVLASHPRIHTCEGLFYRDVLEAAARASGLRARVVPPRELDANDPRLAVAGRIVGKPWNRDWKLASLAAWAVLGG